MNWLLIFVPVAVALEHSAPDQSTWIFAAAGLAIVPLAGWLGRATEQIAERTGEGIGGLLNATFGNAAELIICMAAIRAGLYDVVKASLAGSIIGNILLVLGVAMLCGGIGTLPKPLRGPRIMHSTKADQPELMWTTVPPAKSIE